MNSVSNEVVDRVRALAEPLLEEEGVELVDIEYRREAHGWILRFIMDKEGGITLDDCSRLSQEIGRRLDVEDVIATPYTLEVSSPGLDRPLKREKDFMKYRDRLIRVKTFDPIGKRRLFKGRLLGLLEDQVRIEMEGEIVSIPLSNVAKAQLEIEL